MSQMWDWSLQNGRKTMHLSKDQVHVCDPCRLRPIWVCFWFLPPPFVLGFSRFDGARCLSGWAIRNPNVLFDDGRITHLLQMVLRCMPGSHRGLCFQWYILERVDLGSGLGSFKDRVQIIPGTVPFVDFGREWSFWNCRGKSRKVVTLKNVKGQKENL